MLDARVLEKADAYWASDLGCPVADLFDRPLRLLNHAGGLANYPGVFSLFREGRVMVSTPPERAAEIAALLPPVPFTPDELQMALAPVASRVIGPAFIGYGEVVAAPEQPVRLLDSRDSAAVEALQAACDPEEWEHGGCSPEDVKCGVFDGEMLAALASYEIWGEGIAHISIVSHPAFRRRGYARSAVAGAAGQALAAGLLPQYRTLEGNLASMAIGAALGFERYATSLAVRF